MPVRHILELFLVRGSLRYSIWICLLICFFFFQAEDGIRDSSVTGVQTCALPISNRRPGRNPAPRVAALAATAPFFKNERRFVPPLKTVWNSFIAYLLFRSRC